MPASVIIADDQELVRDGIKYLVEIEAGLEVIHEVSNGNVLPKVLEQKKPDLLILDLALPALGGVKSIEELSAKFPKVKILILTMLDSEDQVMGALEFGAEGYVLKGSSKSEILKAIQAILNGKKYFSGDISGILISNYLRKKTAPSQEKEEEPGQLAFLTKREKETLNMILKGKGNNEIGEALKISRRTAETHRFNLMKKLQVSNLAELTEKAGELDLI